MRRSIVLEAKEEEEEEKERLSWSYSSIQGRNCSDNRAATKLQWNRPMKEEEEEEQNRLFLEKTRAFNRPFNSVFEAKEEEQEEEEERLSWSYSSIRGRNCSDNRAETKLQWENRLLVIEKMPLCTRPCR